MERPNSLTEALFGIPSNIRVKPEVTEGFLERGEYGIDAFVSYMHEMGFSDDVVEDILLEIYREVKSRCMDDPEYEIFLATICSEIGAFYLDRNSEDAEGFLKEAFKLRMKFTSTDSLSMLASTMNRLGIFYAMREKFDKAEVMFGNAYVILKELFSKYDEFEEDYAMAAVNLGTFYYESYRSEESIEYLFEALRHKNVLPCGGAIPSFNIALCYKDLGDTERALEYFLRAAALSIDRGIVNAREPIIKAFEIVKNPREIRSKIEELFLKGEIDRGEYHVLMSLVMMIGDELLKWRPY